MSRIQKETTKGEDTMKNKNEPYKWEPVCEEGEWYVRKLYHNSTPAYLPEVFGSEEIAQEVADKQNE